MVTQSWQAVQNVYRFALLAKIISGEIDGIEKVISGFEASKKPVEKFFAFVGKYENIAKGVFYVAGTYRSKSRRKNLALFKR